MSVVKYMNPILIVLSFILTLVTLFFNFVQGLVDIGIYQYEIAEIADKYVLDISPAGWTFSIWAFIYTALVIFVIYSLTLLCRENKHKTGKLYHEPPFLPPQLYIIYLANLGLNIAWLFIFDNEYIVAAFVALFAIFFTCAMVLFFSFKLLWDYESCLSKTEIWVNIVIVQNGLGLYVTWTGVATCLNLGFVFRYVVGYSGDASCYIALSILLAAFITYFIVDVFIATTRLRYFFTVYIILIHALSGIINENWNADSSVSIYTAVLMAIVCLCFVVKIIALVYKVLYLPLDIEQGGSRKK